MRHLASMSYHASRLYKKYANDNAIDKIIAKYLRYRHFDKSINAFIKSVDYTQWMGSYVSPLLPTTHCADVSVVTRKRSKHLYSNMYKPIGGHCIDFSALAKAVIYHIGVINDRTWNSDEIKCKNKRVTTNTIQIVQEDHHRW